AVGARTDRGPHRLRPDRGDQRTGVATRRPHSDHALPDRPALAAAHRRPGWPGAGRRRIRRLDAQGPHRARRRNRRSRLRCGREHQRPRDRDPATDRRQGMSLHDLAPVANRSSAITAGFRPGRFALRDAWFPVLHSKLLRRRTVRRAIHGEPIFLSRESGVAVAYEDSPADRERGRFRRSAFTGGSGRWPTFERNGYVWVWYGNTDAASTELVPNLPHMPETGMPRFFGGNVIFDCSYELICENLLDLTHFDFLHSALTG